MKNLQTMKQSVQKGFTLIELMIVVAIIGILAALAIPAYTDYTIKSRVSEGASLSGAAKTAIEVYWSENGTMQYSGTGTVIESADVDHNPGSAKYVSTASIVDNGAGSPVILIEMRSGTTKLGDLANATPPGADTGCYVIFPSRSSGSNIEWAIQPNVDFTNGGAACNSIATNAVAPVPSKYRPKE